MTDASPALLCLTSLPWSFRQELAKFEIDSRNIVINQVIFPEEGASTGCG